MIRRWFVSAFAVVTAFAFKVAALIGSTGSALKKVIQSKLGAVIVFVGFLASLAQIFSVVWPAKPAASAPVPSPSASDPVVSKDVQHPQPTPSADVSSDHAKAASNAEISTEDNSRQSKDTPSLPTIIIRPSIMPAQPNPAPEPVAPLRTEGRKLMVKNDCNSPIKIALIFQLPDGRWPTRGFWPVDAKSSTTLKLGDEFPYDFPVASNNPTFYFYAYTETNTWTDMTDKENRVSQVGGRSYPFRKIRLSQYYNEYWLLSLTCDRPGPTVTPTADPVQNSSQE